ncbi:MAG: methyltransferase domain-containing protein [Pseudonocardiaceae bacterium]|nr:methyltransferase domain-containing protein [Pseudonocardiaceae bacterium]
MNEAHLMLCASPEWAELVENRLLPWVLGGHDLGDDVLEIGAGPGLTTDVLRRRAARVTAVELDEALADDLRDRLAGTNVTVMRADATALPLDDNRFSAVTSLTMLHHVPSYESQNQVLAEACRVLRPGGVFLGTDGLDTPERRELHEGDIFLPVEPDRLTARLTEAGFVEPVVECDGDRVRFVASKAR